MHARKRTENTELSVLSRFYRILRIDESCQDAAIMSARTMRGAFMHQPTTVLLADDHPIVRDGLRLMLSLAPEFCVIGEAADGQAALQLIQSLRPQILVLDLDLPKLSGLDVLRFLYAQPVEACAPSSTKVASPKIVVLTGVVDSVSLRRVLEFGVDGLVDKSSSGQDLVEALRLVSNNQRYVSPTVQSLVDVPEPFATLSPREREVLAALARGASSKIIADQLGLSLGTVHKHREHLIQKLGVGSAAELVAIAARAG
jgi:DNA-binding NarL/FixJ family response regulator